MNTKSGSGIRRIVFVCVLIGALLAFELFNYTTTDFALSSLLGNMRFAGLWVAMILAVLFCGVDFVSIAWLSLDRWEKDRLKVRGLLMAWLLTTATNTVFIFWGVFAALPDRFLGISEVQLVFTSTFVAILAWLIRVFLIGTFAIESYRLFTQAKNTLRA